MEVRARRTLPEGIARNAGDMARIGEFHFARFPNDLPGISSKLTNYSVADFSFADMLTDQAIQDAVRRVVEAAHAPLKVILFGSYARGSATEGSDLDLLVVEREVSDTGAEMIRLGDALSHLDVGVDLLVYSEEEFNKRQLWCSTPVYWAVREGKVLYDDRQ